MVNMVVSFTPVCSAQHDRAYLVFIGSRRGHHIRTERLGFQQIRGLSAGVQGSPSDLTIRNEQPTDRVNHLTTAQERNARTLYSVITLNIKSVDTASATLPTISTL